MNSMGCSTSVPICWGPRRTRTAEHAACRGGQHQIQSSDFSSCVTYEKWIIAFCLWHTMVYPLFRDIDDIGVMNFTCRDHRLNFSADPQQAGHLMRLCLEANDARGYPELWGSRIWVNMGQQYSMAIPRMGRFSLAERMEGVSSKSIYRIYRWVFFWQKSGIQRQLGFQVVKKFNSHCASSGFHVG